MEHRNLTTDNIDLSIAYTNIFLNKQIKKVETVYW